MAKSPYSVPAGCNWLALRAAPGWYGVLNPSTPAILRGRAAPFIEGRQSVVTKVPPLGEAECPEFMRD